MTEGINRGLYGFSPFNTAFVRAMYKKGLGTVNKEKTREIEAFARTEIFSQAITGNNVIRAAALILTFKNKALHLCSGT